MSKPCVTTRGYACGSRRAYFTTPPTDIRHDHVAPERGVELLRVRVGSLIDLAVEVEDCDAALQQGTVEEPELRVVSAGDGNRQLGLAARETFLQKRLA